MVLPTLFGDIHRLKCHKNTYPMAENTNALIVKSICKLPNNGEKIKSMKFKKLGTTTFTVLGLAIIQANVIPMAVAQETKTPELQVMSSDRYDEVIDIFVDACQLDGPNKIQATKLDPKYGFKKVFVQTIFGSSVPIYRDVDNTVEFHEKSPFCSMKIKTPSQDDAKIQEMLESVIKQKYAYTHLQPMESTIGTIHFSSSKFKYRKKSTRPKDFIGFRRLQGDAKPYLSITRFSSLDDKKAAKNTSRQLATGFSRSVPLHRQKKPDSTTPTIRVQGIALPPNSAKRSGFCCISYDVTADGLPEKISAPFCSEKKFKKLSISLMGKYRFNPAVSNGVNIAAKNQIKLIPFLISNKDSKLIPDKKNLLISNGKKDLSKARICQAYL